MKLYGDKQIQEALVTSEIDGKALRIALDVIRDLEPAAVIRDCNGCMGATFGDCADCEKIKINEVQK